MTSSLSSVTCPEQCDMSWTLSPTMSPSYLPSHSPHAGFVTFASCVRHYRKLKGFWQLLVWHTRIVPFCESSSTIAAPTGYHPEWVAYFTSKTTWHSEKRGQLVSAHSQEGLQWGGNLPQPESNAGHIKWKSFLGNFVWLQRPTTVCLELTMNEPTVIHTRTGI